MLPTTRARVTRTWWPLHAKDSVYNACRSTTLQQELLIIPRAFHKAYIYRVFYLISCYTYPWTGSLTYNLVILVNSSETLRLPIKKNVFSADRRFLGEGVGSFFDFFQPRYIMVSCCIEMTHG